MTRERDWLIQDTDMNAAVGAELRSARDAAGLTRPELVEQLPFKTTVPTLLNWELGHRAVGYARLVELARTLGRTAPDVLEAAIARVDCVPTLTVEIDLDLLAKGRDEQYALLRRWATSRRAAFPDSGPMVRVHHTVVREWAVLLGVSLPTLVRHLDDGGGERGMGHMWDKEDADQA